MQSVRLSVCHRLHCCDASDWWLLVTFVAAAAASCDRAANNEAALACLFACYFFCYITYSIFHSFSNKLSLLLCFLLTSRDLCSYRRHSVIWTFLLCWHCSVFKLQICLAIKTPCLFVYFLLAERFQRMKNAICDIRLMRTRVWLF